MARQLYKKEDLKTFNRNNLAGGDGTVYGLFSHTREDAESGWAIKEMGWVTLKPGASIGMHRHDINEDACIIVSGTGMFTDSEGKESPIKAGDVVIARKGDSHALKNTGTEDLVYVDVIAQ